MLLLNLDEESRTPKYQQILDQLRHAMETGLLRPGERLPSTRRLASQLGVHRSTVAIAYQELWALGFVDLNPGSRPCVRDRMQMATGANRSGKGMVDWRVTAGAASDTIWQTYLGAASQVGQSDGAPLIDFRSMEVDQRLLPLDRYRACLNRAIEKHGGALVGYGDPAGFAPLREWIAHRLHSHGIAISPDEILITNGSQQGIDLVLRMIAAPGKAVAVESPTYDFVLPLLRFYGLKPLAIPMRPDGMDLSVLEEMVEAEPPALVYTMPSFQNPTGISTNQAHRERLLSLCERYRIPILEDAFEEEMKYFGKAVLPIKSMDQHHTVIYCGTLSKVLFPGVRIGWIAAERECVQRLTAIRRYSDLSATTILQAAMSEFCQEGGFDRHISRMHRVFRKRMQTALDALRRRIAPEWAVWTEPSGGYLIWLQMQPVPSGAVDWTSLFAAHGLKVTLGNGFFCSDTANTHLRLSIAGLNEVEIAEGIRRLAMALSQIYSS